MFVRKDLKIIIKKMNNLFITERKKYIIQKDDGSYNWLEVKESNNVKKFHDYMLELHLRGKSTYGIFCGPVRSKFITFDIDIISPNLVNSIYKELNAIGIQSRYIHTSWSGTKGFHIDIYFSDTLFVSDMKKLYNYIIFKIQQKFPEVNIKEKVEFRPSPSQGLKLPLGINRKNKDADSNICWYVDVKNDFKPIKKLEYILEIEQIDKEFILTIINKLPKDGITKPTFSNKTNKSNLQYIDSESFGFNTTLNSLESLDRNGLTQKGTRNSSLCKLAIYYKALGASKKLCHEKLIIWMNNQDKRFYKTPLEVCYKEIDRIVEGVYKKDIHLKQGKTEIEVSRNEILTLYYYDKILRKTLDALFIHSKRYGDENGEFIMTYNQLTTAVKYSKETAITHIAALEKLKIIEVTRSPIYFEDNRPRNLPNKYKLNFHVNLIDNEENKTTKIEVKDLSDYKSVMTKIIIKLFPNQEWARMDEILESLLIKEDERELTLLKH